MGGFVGDSSVCVVQKANPECFEQFVGPMCIQDSVRTISGSKYWLETNIDNKKQISASLYHPF